MNIRFPLSRARFLISVLLASGFLASCGTTEQIPKSTLRVRTFRLNAKTLTGPVSVLKKGSMESVSTEGFNILHDLLMWIDSESESMMVMAFEAIESFTIRDRGTGLLYGAGIGAAAGLAAGLIKPDLGEQKGAGIIVGMGLGALTGELLGLLIGYRCTYTFDVTH